MHPVFSIQSIYYVARAHTTVLAAAVTVVMSTEEVELSMRVIIKGYHLWCFQVNVHERFTTSKKKVEHGKVFKVTSKHGQLGHRGTSLATIHKYLC